MSSHPSKGILLESGTNEVEFLRFSINKNYYGCNVSKVCQILQLRQNELTKLPEQPSHILGATYFRGNPISVIDLGKALTIEIDEQRKNPLLLVTEFNKKTIGFVIDEVQGIDRITWEHFEPLKSNIFFEHNTSVIGTVKVANSIMMILDLEAIMAEIDPSMRIDSYADQIIPEQKNAGEINREDVKILYAEDSLLIQKVLTKTLNEAGFKNLTLCNSGKTALEEIISKGGPSEFDIILSDIEMPEMDGLTFCKRVRDSDDGKAIPFVFFSSMINDQMKAKCHSVGGNDAFSKPEVHKIVAAIDALVGSK